MVSAVLWGCFRHTVYTFSLTMWLWVFKFNFINKWWRRHPESSNLISSPWSEIAVSFCTAAHYNTKPSSAGVLFFLSPVSQNMTYIICHLLDLLYQVRRHDVIRVHNPKDQIQNNASSHMGTWDRPGRVRLWAWPCRKSRMILETPRAKPHVHVRIELQTLSFFFFSH